MKAFFSGSSTVHLSGECHCTFVRPMAFIHIVMPNFADMSLHTSPYARHLNSMLGKFILMDGEICQAVAPIIIQSIAQTVNVSAVSANELYYL